MSETSSPGSGSRAEADPDVTAVVRADEARVGADQHHPLEADVQHAGALGDRLAERGEHQRHAGEQPPGDRRS